MKEEDEEEEKEKKKSKAILVTGSGGPQVCGMPRLPHFLENQLTDGGDVVSLRCWPPFTPPPEDSWYSFLFEAESTPKPQRVWKVVN
jgi:hypothetical protein